jgi:hypothetical protein
MMQDARRRIVQGQDLDPDGFLGGLQVLEEEAVVARLDADDVGRVDNFWARCVGWATATGS